jgi:hypothetical protein
MHRSLATAGILVFMLLAAPGRAEMPRTLIEGLGNHHHPIATNNAEAQKFFDQGLNFPYLTVKGQSTGRSLSG